MESVSDAVTAVAAAAVTPMARAPLATTSAILAGLALHLAGQLARARAWVAIVRRAAPDADAGPAPLVTAWMVGAGASGVLPSRAGDGVRLVLARRVRAASHAGDRSARARRPGHRAHADRRPVGRGRQHGRARLRAGGPRRPGRGLRRRRLHGRDDDPRDHPRARARRRPFGA